MSQLDQYQKPLSRKQKKRLDKQQKKEQKNKDSHFATIGEIASKCYYQHGRGVCMYVKGMLFHYIPRGHRLLGDKDNALIDSYDPETQLVVTSPQNEKDLQGVWMTQLIGMKSKTAQCRIKISKEYSVDDIVSDCLFTE